MPSSLSDIQVGLSAFYAAAFPSREHVRICDVIKIGEGWESEICGFRMEHEQAGERMSEDLILRIYQGDRAAQKAAREFNGMRRLHQEGFPVPRVSQLVTENSPFGKPFVIMDRIVGRTMADVLAESSQARMLQLLNCFCEMFVQLHALDWRPFVSDPAPYETVGPISLWLSGRREFIHQLRVDAFDPVFDWLGERRSEVPCERLAVIHGDYHPYNVLVRDDGVAFVIDWTNIRVSDFRFDLAWTLLLT